MDIGIPSDAEAKARSALLSDRYDAWLEAHDRTERAAALREAAETMPGGGREGLSLVLTDHQRASSDKCLCGWGELGRSHPLHQADAIIEWLNKGATL